MQSNPPPVPQHVVAPRPVFELQRAVLIFFGALAGMVLSKGLALMPGYGLDDYVAIHSPRAVLSYLGQGRFTQALIQYCVVGLKLTTTSIAFPTTVLFFLCAAVAITDGLRYVARERGDAWCLAGIAGLIAAHPYLTEYFSYRESLITQGTAFALLAVILRIAVQRDQDHDHMAVWRSDLWLCGPMVLMAGAQQTVFVVLGLFILARIAMDALEEKGRINLKFALRINAPMVLPYLLAVVLYILAFFVCTRLSGQARDPRAGFIGWGDVMPRLRMVRYLIPELLLHDEVILTASFKTYLFAMTLPFLGFIALEARRRALTICLTGVLMTFASIALVCLSADWWPVPRALYGMGFALGIVLAMMTVWLAPNCIPMFRAAVLMGALGFAFYSSTMLNDQLRLNRWDMRIAGEIAHDLEVQGVTPNQKVYVVDAHRWMQPAFAIGDGDLNRSALSIDWSFPYVMQEATGSPWNVAVIHHAEACHNSSVWPAPGAIQTGNGAIFVCM